MTPLDGALGGILLAALLLVPLSVKWQLPRTIVLAWTAVIGAAGGALWALVLGSGAALWPWVLCQAATVLVVSAAGAGTMFFRDPEREPPGTPDVLVSPADGVVLYVRQFREGTAPPIEKQGRALAIAELAKVDVGGDGHVVGIGMHLLNVHVNRAPIAGRVVTLLHVPGRFESLKREDATCVNERFTTVIEGERGPVVVVQIASRLVRRIVSYLAVGRDVARGQRIGMIKFGSQVDLIVADSEALEILVTPGEAVQAGVSVVGRYAHKNTAKE